ncbi:hypothetical protein AKO1_005951 [Acrasis kona]|uniref:Uncharacterized protein n=1 Tax=Acrasis kona TaxID=1008807 RepID=A0AAW2YJY4_9EUKA
MTNSYNSQINKVFKFDHTVEHRRIRTKIRSELRNHYRMVEQVNDFNLGTRTIKRGCYCCSVGCRTKSYYKKHLKEECIHKAHEKNSNEFDKYKKTNSPFAFKEYRKMCCK